MKHAHKIAFLLLIVGGLNWLLWGAFQWEIGMLLGGSDAVLSRIVYVLVGLAAVYELFAHKKTCKECSMKGAGATTEHTQQAPASMSADESDDHSSPMQQ